MRLELNRKPEGEWASFNEFCGKGDGETREFMTPIPASQAREILVTRAFEFLTPDQRRVEKNEKTGEILSDVGDGYTLSTRNEDELWIVFDRPVPFGARVAVSGLGRQVGDAFRILPMTSAIQKQLEEKQPENLRKREKRKDATIADLRQSGSTTFMDLVADWHGITDENGNALPCDEKTRSAFLSQTDSVYFGMFVTHRSAALRAERMNSFAVDSRD